MSFGQEDTIISSVSPDMQSNEPSGKFSLKKMLIIAGIILLVIGLIGGGFLLINKFSAKKKPVNNQPVIASSSQINATGSLPILGLPSSATTTSTTTAFSDIAIEYLTFADFYKAPDNTITPKFSDYSLPVNVKIDVSNYYDLSRKLNLDPALDNLSKNGFSTIANPWEIDASDFYSIYSKLESQQVPILITSDFILYYYQNTFKKVYKDIEENIFYDNLWSITKDIYESAKNRYEARLASIGAVNDSVLEGERLEVAFFAVALELLTPADNQVSPQGTLDDNNKFLATEANKFYFVTPAYLSDDVDKEIKLIRAAKDQTKSPVMLYNRDYKDFVVPTDYRSNAKLNNFYLASHWLNSVFPLNYKDKNCPNCLLDKEDWRLSMIAASLISADFSNSPELKNEWARIYKVMSYFNPLREDLNYVYYRDAIKSIFGENYNIEELFNDKNPEAKNNFQKLQEKLNATEFSPFLGAIAKDDPAVNNRIGFKMLVESYSPNDYIFENLTSPSVTTYQGVKPTNNVTNCKNKNNSSYYRCNGMALDVVNLIQPITNNAYFDENTNYLNYKSEVTKLNDKLNKDVVWHMNNYWSTLAAISAYLNMNKTNLPIFSHSIAWRDQTLDTAASAWINMQLPLDKFSTNQNSSSFSRFSDNLYVEPNLNLVNELLANNDMMTKMFSALQVDSEVISIPNTLQTVNNNLLALKGIITKELTGQALDEDDKKAISDFATQLTIEKTTVSQKQLTLKTTTKNSLVEDLNHLKLMVLMHQDGDSKVLSVGPVWDYRETR
jgi:hypothetical protein